MQQADSLLRMLRESLSRDQFEDCRLFSSIGFDHRFQPETFSLEPGQWIAWDINGATITYAALARRIGDPNGARAVASACAANAIALGIPCHRVIRRNGTIAGYRWGVELKRSLIDKEATA